MFLFLIWNVAIIKDIKAPEIKIIDPRAKIYIGTDTLNITLEDMLKYTGKICPGVSTGIRLTILGLNALYGDSLPVRGEVMVAVPYEGEIANVISYITGARMKFNMIVDSSLIEDTVVSYVFSRKKVKSVRITFNENKIHGHHGRLTLKEFKKIIEEIINGDRDSLFTIKESSYTFPEFRKKHIHEDEEKQ